MKQKKGRPERGVFMGYCIGHMPDAKIIRVGLYTEPSPTTLGPEFQVVVASYGGPSVEAALRGAAIYGVHRAQPCRELLFMMHETKELYDALMVYRYINKYFMPSSWTTAAQVYIETGQWPSTK